ncbi:hypothetical protein Cgig2_026956 [Carnegiea gigantea]|uniref:Uncharacterized protein n=1 Tax=Carnegiea gigantea TaxID=171969 RepID=A0A9Q1KX06_9CARY|nr:hypothetical protein Cgig2_026956 [Carnegiea gigantea]
MPYVAMTLQADVQINWLRIKYNGIDCRAYFRPDRCHGKLIEGGIRKLKVKFMVKMRNSQQVVSEIYLCFAREDCGGGGPLGSQGQRTPEPCTRMGRSRMEHKPPPSQPRNTHLQDSACGANLQMSPSLQSPLHPPSLKFFYNRREGKTVTEGAPSAGLPRDSGKLSRTTMGRLLASFSASCFSAASEHPIFRRDRSTLSADLQLGEYCTGDRLGALLDR